MKIAMFGQKGIPSRKGGVEIHVEELAKRLVKMSCDVTVFCRRGYCDVEENTVYEGIKIVFTPFIKQKHLDAISHTFISTIIALFKGCDVFHYHALGPSTMAIIPRLFGKKVVVTVHGLDWQRAKWGFLSTSFLKFGEFSSAKFANATINVSKNLVKYYNDKYGIDSIYIPNGIEKPKIVEPSIILEKYGLNKDDYVLFLARLVPEKGAHYLIDAYKSIRTDKKLVIAGGESHSTNYAESLKELAKGFDNILFTGFVSGKELDELYSNAYLYVLPSDIEGLPISLLEAMSYGNCCLTSDIPENINVTEQNGYAFKKSDTKDLKKVLMQLIDEPSKVIEKRMKSMEHVLNEYKWDDISKKTFAVYSKVMK